MKYLKICFFGIALLVSPTCYAKDVGPFQSVQDLFQAMSAFDAKGIKETVTDDFQILDMGAVWDITQFLSALKSLEGKFKERRNYFNVIRTVSSQNTTWISYWNKAVVTTVNNQTITLTWLESAVLVKDKNQWKIQHMHSTSVAEDSIPSDVVFTGEAFTLL